MKEVALGLPGPWADNNLEAADHYTTKAGGLPDWPFPESSVGPGLLPCNLCRSNLCLIAQVYAPINTAALKIEERILYVFGCTDLHCGSWRALRVQRPNISEEPKIDEQGTTRATVSTATASETKWWSDLYSFEPGSENGGEDNGMDLMDLAKALSDAANLASVSVKKETKSASGSVKEGTKRHTEPQGKALSMAPKSRKVDDSTLVLPCFYISYDEDKSSQSMVTASSSSCSPSVEEALVKKDDNDDPTQEEAWEGESYEYDKALNADRTYLKFKKRMDRCPEQCFRYSYGGKPLLATGSFGDAGQCCICGETRHYEMQLMPPLVYFLQEKAIGAQRDLVDKWNWLTLMVFTCSENCFQNLDRESRISREGWTVAEETVIAQFENEKPLSESSKLSP